MASMRLGKRGSSEATTSYTVTQESQQTEAELQAQAEKEYREAQITEIDNRIADLKRARTSVNAALRDAFSKSNDEKVERYEYRLTELSAQIKELEDAKARIKAGENITGSSAIEYAKEEAYRGTEQQQVRRENIVIERQNQARRLAAERTERQLAGRGIIATKAGLYNVRKYEQQVNLSAISTVRTVETKRATIKQQVPEVYGPPTPSKASRLSKKIYEGLPPSTKIDIAIGKGIVAGVQKVKKFQKLKKLRKQKEEKLTKAEARVQLANVVSMTAEYNLNRINPRIESLNQDIEQFNNNPNATQAEYESLQQRRETLNKEILEFKKERNLSKKLQTKAEKEIANVEALENIEKTKYGEFSKITSPKVFDISSKVPLEKGIEKGLNLASIGLSDIAAFERGFAEQTTFKVIPPFGSKAEKDFREAFEKIRISTSYTAPIFGLGSSEFKTGIIKGAVESVRERPLKVAAFTGLGFGVGMATSALAATPTATNLLTSPAGKALLTGGKVALGGAFAVEKGLEIGRAEGDLAKGEVIGKTLSSELVPSYLGFKTGVIAGRGAFGEPKAEVQTKSKQREIYRDEEGKNVFEIEAKQRVKFLGEKKGQEIFIKGMTETQQITRKDIIIDVGEGDLSRVYIRKKQFYIQTENVPQFVNLLEREGSLTFSESVFKVQGEELQGLGRSRGLSMGEELPQGKYIRSLSVGGIQTEGKAFPLFFAKDISKEVGTISEIGDIGPRQMFVSLGTQKNVFQEKGIGMGVQIVEAIPEGKTTKVPLGPLFGLDVIAPEVIVGPKPLDILPVSEAEFKSLTAGFIIPPKEDVFVGTIAGSALIPRGGLRMSQKDLSLMRPRLETKELTKVIQPFKEQEQVIEGLRMAEDISQMEVSLPRTSTNIKTAEKILPIAGIGNTIFTIPVSGLASPPPFAIPSFQGGWEQESKLITGRFKQSKGYTPSLTAIALNIFGDVNTNKMFTGAEFRPIPNIFKRSKKKKKRGKKKR